MSLNLVFPLLITLATLVSLYICFCCNKFLPALRGGTGHDIPSWTKRLSSIVNYLQKKEWIPTGHRNILKGRDHDQQQMSNSKWTQWYLERFFFLFCLTIFYLSIFIVVYLSSLLLIYFLILCFLWVYFSLFIVLVCVCACACICVFLLNCSIIIC